jgi:hypothetical protein
MLPTQPPTLGNWLQQQKSDLDIVSLTSLHTIDMAASSLCSLRRLLPHWARAVVVAWDRPSFLALQNEGVPVVLEEVVRIFRQRGRGAAVFSRRGRPLQFLKFWVLSVAALHSVDRPLLLADADVWYLDRVAFPLIRAHCRDTPARGDQRLDVLTMQESMPRTGYPSRANAGFVLSCGTERAHRFWRHVGRSVGIGQESRHISAAEGRLLNLTTSLHRLADRGDLVYRGDAPINDQHVLSWELVLASARAEVTWGSLNRTRFGNAARRWRS